MDHPGVGIKILPRVPITKNRKNKQSWEIDLWKGRIIFIWRNSINESTYDIVVSTNLNHLKLSSFNAIEQLF